MTKEEWIAEAKERIANNLEYIEYARTISSRESFWHTVKHERQRAFEENKFLEEGIKLLC